MHSSTHVQTRARLSPRWSINFLKIVRLILHAHVQACERGSVSYVPKLFYYNISDSPGGFSTPFVTRPFPRVPADRLYAAFRVFIAVVKHVRGGGGERRTNTEWAGGRGRKRRDKQNTTEKALKKVVCNFLFR